MDEDLNEKMRRSARSTLTCACGALDGEELCLRRLGACACGSWTEGDAPAAPGVAPAALWTERSCACGALEFAPAATGWKRRCACGALECAFGARIQLYNT